jgi:hypothetical protein
MKKITLLLVLVFTALSMPTITGANEEPCVGKHCYNICSRKPDPDNYEKFCYETHPNPPDHTKCAGCDKPPPACCEMIEKTGNYLYCCGYWERLWCAPYQCDTIRGDKQMCGHAAQHYCGKNWRRTNRITPTKTPTPTVIPPTITPTEIPTVTLTPSPTQTVLLPTPIPPTATPTSQQIFITKIPSPSPLIPLVLPTKSAVRHEININLDEINKKIYKTINFYEFYLKKILFYDKMLEFKINSYLKKIFYN